MDLFYADLEEDLDSDVGGPSDLFDASDSDPSGSTVEPQSQF